MPSQGFQAWMRQRMWRAVLDDLAGDVDESGPEGAELHREQSAALLFVDCSAQRG